MSLLNKLFCVLLLLVNESAYCQMSCDQIFQKKVAAVFQFPLHAFNEKQKELKTQAEKATRFKETAQAFISTIDSIIQYTQENKTEFKVETELELLLVFESKLSSFSNHIRNSPEFKNDFFSNNNEASTQLLEKVSRLLSSEDFKQFMNRNLNLIYHSKNYQNGVSAQALNIFIPTLIPIFEELSLKENTQNFSEALQAMNKFKNYKYEMSDLNQKMIIRELAQLNPTFVNIHDISSELTHVNKPTINNYLKNLKNGIGSLLLKKNLVLESRYKIDPDFLVGFYTDLKLQLMTPEFNQVIQYSLNSEYPPLVEKAQDIKKLQIKLENTINELRGKPKFSTIK